MKKSWRTTTNGILALVLVLTGTAKAVVDGDPTTNPDWALVAAAIATAWGLLVARDDKVTSEASGAKAAEVADASANRAKGKL